ncbi:MAG: hypothetical protein WAL47_04480 [Pyrinomonadaceae bacterium]
MITGFNTDIEHDGVVYHVQTEDKGLETPLILSLVYSGGAILASKRARYEDLIAAGFSDEALSERLTRQHKLICAAIHAGRIEDLKRMSGARGEAASVATPPPQLDSEPEPEPELETQPELTTEFEPQPEAEVEPESASEPESDLEILRGEQEFEALEEARLAYAETQKEAAFDETADLTIEEKLSPPSEYVTTPLDENQLYSVHDHRQSVMGDLPQATEGLRITLLGRHEFKSGTAITVKVMVGWRSGNQEKAVAKAAVSVKVLGTSFRPQLYSAKTHSDGVAAVATKIPSFTSGRAAILIRAVFEGHETELRRIIHPG